MRFSPDGSKLVIVSTDYCGSIFRDGIRVWDAETGYLLAFNYTYPIDSIKWMTFTDGDEVVVQANSKLDKLKLCAVSRSSPTIDPSEEMAGTSTPRPFDLVLLTDDELTIQPPSPSYRLLQNQSMEWDNQWIVDSQRRRVFHWLDASASACHMRKVAVGTYTGRVGILDFSNVTY
jgi:WD40 repeat protein